MHVEPHGSPRPQPKTLEERLADEARFIRTWFENPVGTGAVSPSGRFLARAMARAVDPGRPGPIVELGPGTGPVTDALIARGVAPERLVLVEFDPDFCRLLQDRYPGATVVRGDAYDLAATLAGVVDGPVAAVVSSLPLRNQPERDRLTLLSQAFAVLQPGGGFVQFTYGIASPMPLRGSHRPCFEAEVSPPVWLNLPPARVWVYRAAEAPALIRMRDGARLRLNPECPPVPKLDLKRKARQARDEIRLQAERVVDGLKARRRGERPSPVPAGARQAAAGPRQAAADARPFNDGPFKAPKARRRGRGRH